VPGVEDLAAAELESLGARVTGSLAGFDRRASLLFFDTADPGKVVREAALLEDVFAVLIDAPAPAGRTAPRRMASMLEPRVLDSALRERQGLGARRGRSYKVVARVAGRQAYRRSDIEAAFTRRLHAILPHWVPERGAAAVELWAHVIGERLVVALRLSTDELAQRRWKRAHLPASLKPTVARALVALAGTGAGRICVDPMCGAGTIVRECRDATADGIAAGGDIDPDAVRAARVNAGRRAALARWDATRLPLRDASVDAIVTNPPFGRQHEAGPGVRALYRAVLRESARVLRPGGRCVVLTAARRPLEEALPPALRVRSRRRLLLRGLSATAFTLERT